MTKRIVIVVLLLLSVSVLYGVTRIYSVPRASSEPPPDDAKRVDLPINKEEQIREIIEIGREIEKNSSISYVSGPETAGSKIRVSGKLIQLPEDVWVETAPSLGVLCLELPCGPLRGMRLQRGDVRIWVARDGIMRPDDGRSEQGFESDKEHFRFIENALKGLQE